MYNLSEQPVRKIVKEMSDFSSLKKIGIFAVKEKFNIKDTYYEVGDLVAIRGQHADEISIISYDKLKEYSSYMLADDNELKKLFNNYFSTTMSDFHERFELSESETDKTEIIMNEIKSIVDVQKKAALSNENDYFSLFFFPLGLLTILLAGCSGVGFWGYVVGCIFAFIGFIFGAFSCIRLFKAQKVNKNFRNKLSELDKKRMEEGLYNKLKET